MNFNPSYVNEFTTGLPYIVVAGFAIIGDPRFNPAIIAMNNYQFSTNADMTDQLDNG